MHSTGPPSPSTAPPCSAPAFAAWRAAARALLAQGVPPARVCWTAEGAPFSGAPAARRPPHHSSTQLTRPQAGPRLPRALIALLGRAACCRVPYRWDVLYRVVWRWQRGGALQDGADPDLRRLRAMARAVRDEEQAMQQKIRFHERAADAGAPRFVAWCEPAHDVLPQVAGHFVRRMGGVSWMIATPEASVLWDGARLHNCGPLVGGADELHGEGLAPWLAYYRSVFAGAAPPVLAHAGRGRRVIPLLPAGGERAGGGAPAGSGNPEVDPATLDECRRCDLWQHATQAVGGAGSKRARIMLVGEQPGDQEDIAGAPFVGPAGKLLDRVCEQAGVDRRTLYLTNAVKHFKWEPRGKRRLHKTPAQREIEACSYWLDQELAQVKPEVVVALGTTALKAVLGTSRVTLKDTLGQAMRHEGRWVVTIYHPSYALRVPDEAARKQAFAVMVDGLKLAASLLAPPRS